MTVTAPADLSPAGWIAASGRPWERLMTLGPPGFAAYARLRFIPDPAYAGQSEGDVDVAADHLSDAAQIRAAVETLLRHTGTPDDGYLLVWEGWGHEVFPRRALLRPRLTLPGRAYHLFRVPLPDLVSGAAEAAWEREGGSWMPEPAFVWPADRAWCVTADVDPHWAGIGAAPAAVDALLADPRLDVVRTDPDAQQPFYH